jgi:hypothetical protein
VLSDGVGWGGKEGGLIRKSRWELVGCPGL